MKTRRDFIKISALGIGAATLASGTFKWVWGAGPRQSGAADSSSLPQLSRYPTYCEVCFWKCAGWVYLNEEGQIQKVIGNDLDPHCN